MHACRYCNNPGGSCGWVKWANAFYFGARLYQLALTDELLGTDAAAAATAASGTGSSVSGASPADGTHRFARGGRVHVRHTRVHRSGMAALAAARTTTDIPSPSVWPYGGDTIPIVNDFGGLLLPLVNADGDTLASDTLHAYPLAAHPPPDPDCPLYSADPTEYTGANNTALGTYGIGFYAQIEFDPSLPEEHCVSVCNATCWANATGCAAWDLIKVTPTSGKVKPLCSLYASAAGCESDTNQWSGVKSPLPVPSPDGLVNQTWTLPLSWVGLKVSATTLTPEGEVPGPDVLIVGRNFTLAGVQPGCAVRLQTS